MRSRVKIGLQAALTHYSLFATVYKRNGGGEQNFRFTFVDFSRLVIIGEKLSH